MNESRAHIQLLIVTGLLCSMLAVTAYAGRRHPDDPAGAPVFSESLNPELNEKVRQVQQQYVREVGQSSTMSNLVMSLASYEFVTEKSTGQRHQEVWFAERDLKTAGSNAVPALIAGLSYPNVRIRRLALAILYNITADAEREAAILPVFLRSAADVNSEVRQTAVGAIGMICRSLAKIKRYEDCAVCIEHIVDALNDDDELVRYRAADLLYRFDRLERVPKDLQEMLANGVFSLTRPWLCPLPRGDTDDGGVTSLHSQSELNEPLGVGNGRDNGSD